MDFPKATIFRRFSFLIPRLSNTDVLGGYVRLATNPVSVDLMTWEQDSTITYLTQCTFIQRSHISFGTNCCCCVFFVFFLNHFSMVPMYDGNVITVLLIFHFQGGLRNSKHEFTLSSQEYVHELRSGITEEKLLNCLESLRVSLTSNPVRLAI